MSLQPNPDAIKFTTPLTDADDPAEVLDPLATTPLTEVEPAVPDVAEMGADGQPVSPGAAVSPAPVPERVSSRDGQSSTVYVTAHGPGAIDTEGVSNLLAGSDLGGAVKSHVYGSDFVTLVVEVDGAVDEQAYDLVIGKTRVALGPDWTVVATVDASEG
jgi:hypothetical protein